MTDLFFIRMGLPMMLGILCAFQFEGVFTIAVASWTMLSLLTALSFGVLFFGRIVTYRHRAEWLILVFSLYFYGGVWLCLYHKYISRANHDSRSVFQVRLVDEPQQKLKFIRCQAIILPETPISWPNKPEKILLTIFNKDDPMPQLSYGDELIVKSRIKPITPSLKTARFDMQRWMAIQHVYRQVNVRVNEFITINSDRGNPIISYAFRLRKQQVKKLTALIKDKDASSVAVTLILGYRSDLSASTLKAYTTTGTVHALSVSGMHVGLIYLSLEKILWLLNKRRWSKVLKVILILLFIWSYALLTGLSPAVLRSALMISVLIIAKALHQNTSGLNILAFSACVLLVADPFLLFDMGFQLSYLSVFGLLSVQPAIRRWVTFNNYLARNVWDAIALSLSAQLFTFPLALYYFHQFPVYFLLSNLLIAIPVSLMMYLGMLILISQLNFLTPALEWLIIFTNKTLRWISGLPLASIQEIRINIFGMCCLYLAIALLTIGLITYRTKLLLAGLICLLILAINQFQYKLHNRDIPLDWPTFIRFKVF